MEVDDQMTKFQMSELPTLNLPRPIILLQQLKSPFLRSSRAVLHVICTGLFRTAWHLRLRLRHLGRGEPGAELQDLDVRRQPGDCALLARRTHIQVRPSSDPRLDLFCLFSKLPYIFREFFLMVHGLHCNVNVLHTLELDKS